MTRREERGEQDVLGWFDALGQWLLAHRARWSEPVFTKRRLAWEGDDPALSAALRGMEDQAIDAAQAAMRGDSADALGASALSPLAEAMKQGHALLRPVERALPARAMARVQVHTAQLGIAGRKWSQLSAVCDLFEALGPARPGRLVDWCGGYGHLGRTLGYGVGARVTVLELEAERRARALSRAHHMGVALDFVQADALDASSASALDGADAALALHACGALGEALVRGAHERDVPWVFTAPCCPHVLGPGQAQHVPMSAAGQARGLDLDRQALRAAVLEEVVISPHERAKARQEKAWRLALDELLREASGQDRYFSLGPQPRTLFRGDFEAFARAQAEALGVELPARLDAQAALADGERLARQVRALELVRAAYRRPLEVWLLLDRAAWALERGRQARVGAFCDWRVTPRNLALIMTAR